MLQWRLKILCATTETQCSQVKKYINKYLKKRKIQRTEVEGGRNRKKRKGRNVILRKRIKNQNNQNIGFFNRALKAKKKKEKTVLKFRRKMIIELYDLFKLWNKYKGRIKIFQICKGFTCSHTNHHQRKLVTQCFLHKKQKIIRINYFYFMEVQWEKINNQKKAWWNLNIIKNEKKNLNHLNLLFIQQTCTKNYFLPALF